MKFGKVADPSRIDFSLPADSGQTSLGTHLGPAPMVRVSIGYPKFDPKQLSGFYPDRVRDPLRYYSSRLNAIEFNATYRRAYPPEQFRRWADRTPDEFRFYPKVPQSISRYRRLVGAGDQVASFLEGLDALESKLGMAFLQMDNSFSPRSFADLEAFLVAWPSVFPLALELRHHAWYDDRSVVETLYQLLTDVGVTFVLTDTHSRRDMLHMQFPTRHAFIRFVDSDHSMDYIRLDAWAARIQKWKTMGLEGVHFFVHRKEVTDAPVLVNYLSTLLVQSGSLVPASQSDGTSERPS